eukprot:2217077-Pyramimonas_sp.AAC.1
MFRFFRIFRGRVLRKRRHKGLNGHLVQRVEELFAQLRHRPPRGGQHDVRVRVEYHPHLQSGTQRA